MLTLDRFPQETMITKGVASVPSPVRNLVEWSPRFDHAAFVSRVAEEFAAVYGGSAEPIVSRPGIFEARDLPFEFNADSSASVNSESMSASWSTTSTRRT